MRSASEVLAARNETVRTSRLTTGSVLSYWYCYVRTTRSAERKEGNGVTVTLDESSLASGVRPSRVCSTNANVLASFESFSGLPLEITAAPSGDHPDTAHTEVPLYRQDQSGY